MPTGLRASSCTKEEVDAILIQCGRLSRSNSAGKLASSGSKKYSGSKRSYDFDNEQQSLEDDKGENDAADQEETRRDRHRHRAQRHHSSPAGASSQGRRRTPSRERDQRSGSRERAGNGNSGRRVSRSPARRSDSNSTVSVGSNGTSKPAKMMSVPPTVAVDKGASNGVELGTVNRITVKRNAGEVVPLGVTRAGASPRSVSPARTNSKAHPIPAENGGQQQQQQQSTLSRSSSRKAEHSPSPYRRNPLAEIDSNALPGPLGNRTSATTKKQITEVNNWHCVVDEVNCQGKNMDAQDPKIKKEDGSPIFDEGFRPQAITRSRSGRRSRELDINPEALLSNNPPSYTALLLEDIQNFHQKSTPAPVFPLPPCLSKACSILEAVADLNATTYSDDRRSAVVANLVGKPAASDNNEPFLESEIQACDDLTEPSFQKYVTFRDHSSLPVEDTDGQESSGSNSYVGGSSGHPKQWESSYSCDPNSADSTERWSSRSITISSRTQRDNKIREDNRSIGFSSQRTVRARPVPMSST